MIKNDNSQYRMKDGTIIKVGDLVLYREGDGKNNPTGYVSSIEKKWSRWRATVTMFDLKNNIEVYLHNFHQFFVFANSEDYYRKE